MLDNHSISFIEGIQSTAGDALKLKISAVNKKYYEDPFIFELEHKKTHKNLLPLMNRGTWSRVFGIMNSIEKVLTGLAENNPETKVNILSLGAGFDTFYFLLKQKFNNFKYYEFDYGDITFKKIEMIKKSKVLLNVISNSTNNSQNISSENPPNHIFQIKAGNLISNDYFLYDCDITNYETFNQILCAIPDFDFSLPTIVIAECLLVYIKKETTIEMLQNLTKVFKNVIFFEYDLIGAHDNFGKEMVSNLLERDVKLFGYEDTPDVPSQTERLVKSGFTHVEVVDMLEYYNKCIDPIEKKRIQSLEFVDEFEEFDLLQQHACFGCATKLEEKYEYLNDILKFN